MHFTLDLEYTPRCPQTGMPFTESSFLRKGVPFEFDVEDVGVALVDLWNFGWEDGPVGETLGPELSFERGRAHAERKRRIIEQRIAPTVDELRRSGVQIFHCNHAEFLQNYPEWLTSTMQQEREALAAKRDAGKGQPSEPQPKHDWPPPDWVADWREQHRELVFCMRDWGDPQGKEVYPKIAIPKPVEPKAGDLLVYDHEQFHRLLSQKRIRALFYMGFEADECVQFSDYGIANMQDESLGFGYLCTVVRDCTTTYEVAETLEGFWKARLAINSIETRFGYSVTSDALLTSIRSVHSAAR